MHAFVDGFDGSVVYPPIVGIRVAASLRRVQN
jgi:hypothetical protein